MTRIALQGLAAAGLLAGLSGSAASAGVLVTNYVTVNHSLSSNNPSLAIDEGQSITVAFDVSATANSGTTLSYFGLNVDWGDFSNGSTVSAGSNANETQFVTHTFANDSVAQAGGIYTIALVGGIPSAPDPDSYAIVQGAFNGPVPVNGILGTIKVNNVAPALTSAPAAVVSLPHGSTFSFTAAATDPGLLDVLDYDWKLDAIDQGDDTDLYDDLTNSAAIHRIFAPGTYELGLRVTDGDGGMDFREFTLYVAAIPEPASLSLLGLAGLGLLRRRR